jgi:hypothetical protein
MSSRIATWLIVGGLATVLAFAGGASAALGQEPVPVKREILALYDGAQEGDADLTRIHRIAELPLNHLGFVLRFHDIRTKLPEPVEMERYRGVLTWFVGSVPDGNGYLAWASHISRMNVRYVILGDIGVVASPANLPVVNRLLNLAGVRHTGDYVAPTLGTRVVQKDQGLIEFECRLDPVLSDYPVINASGAGTRVGLMLETPSRDGKRKAVMVAIGERGGYAALNYEYCHQRSPLYQGKWLVDPFAFLRAAFGSDGQPIPDTTTASGNRLYFNVLSNEGGTRSSGIEGFRNAMAGEVILRDLIGSFDDLPATIVLQDKEAGKLGRDGRQAETLSRRLLSGTSTDLSLRRLRATLSRFDTEYPSISNLSPLIDTGPDRLINLPMSDETYYNKAGAVGENGFAALTKTVTNTELPRRLAPFNLNYHAYAAEYPAEFQSIKDRLREARQADLTPVSANRYAAIVDGFFSARVDRLGDARWRISNRGELQTIRFDDVDDGREADLSSSVGVIGQKRHGKTLYVALDAAIEPATIVLRPSSFSGMGPHGFNLVESRWLVRHVVKDECALAFEAQGYGGGSFTWSDVAPGHYMIAVERAGHEVWRRPAEVDGTGSLRFAVPVGATDPVMIRVNCVSAVRAAEQ